MTTANIISAIAGGPAPSASTTASSTLAVTGSPEEQPFGALVVAVQADGGKAATALTDPSAKAAPPVAMQLATQKLPGKGRGDLTVPAALPSAAEEPIAPDGEAPLPAPGEEAATEEPSAPATAGPLATAPKPAPAPTQPGAEVVAAPIVAATGPVHKPTPGPHGEKASDATAEKQDAILQAMVPESLPAPAIADAVTPPPVVMAAHLAEPVPQPLAEPARVALDSPEPSGKEPIGTAPLAATDTQDAAPTPHAATREAALPQSDSLTAKGSDQGSIASTTFAQSLPALPVRAAVQLYGGVAPGSSVDQPVISAQAGQMGHDMGVAIARGVDAGRDALLVRLDPAELGRVHVRLSFDHDGAVRVAMSAESSTALDLLRREAGDLGRALNDAGVRSDSQSFRFDGGSDARQFAQQRGSGNGNANRQEPFPSLDDTLPEAPVPQRTLRSAGGLNLII